MFPFPRNKKRRYEPARVAVWVNIAREDRDALRKLALDNDRKVSAQARVLIKDVGARALEKHLAAKYPEGDERLLSRSAIHRHVNFECG